MLFSMKRVPCPSYFVLFFILHFLFFILHFLFFIFHSSFFIFHSSFNRNGFSCMNIKKGLTLQPNLVNLKSNTMKNTLQRYGFFSFFKQKKNIFLFFL